MGIQQELVSGAEMTPFERLQKALKNSGQDDYDDREVLVLRSDLEIALKFLKWHRRWRLYDGHVTAKKIEPNAKLYKKIDKYRVKYYSKLFGVNLKDIVERVTKYMRDALHGGGNTEEPVSIIEAYLHPEKYSAKRKTSTEGKDRKSGRRSRRVSGHRRRRRTSS